jgi:putative spermidine/putrescine transport system ATP-binding protein
MSRIRFEGVSKSYGDTIALNGFDLDVGNGELLALLGPSGCGKTTALRLLAGFLRPSAGRIFFDDRDVSLLPPHKRNAGMVFQDYALFPHLTVEDNIAFGLHERGQKGVTAKRRAAELLDLVRLAGMEGRYPDELSGGQQQRVALARALAFRPSVLLMDEPFGALDLKLREAMQAELVQIQDRLAITTIFVTHDQVEAMAVADRIAVMSGGRIAQLGTPQDVYERPQNAFVARFVGRINLFDARVTGLAGDTAVLDANGLSLTAVRAPWTEIGMDVDAAVRPESLTIRAPGQLGPVGYGNVVEGKVVASRYAGAVISIEVATASIGHLTIEARSGDPPLTHEAPVSLAWAYEKTILLRKQR